MTDVETQNSVILSEVVVSEANDYAVEGPLARVSRQSLPKEFSLNVFVEFPEDQSNFRSR